MNEKWARTLVIAHFRVTHCWSFHCLCLLPWLHFPLLRHGATLRIRRHWVQLLVIGFASLHFWWVAVKVVVGSSSIVDVFKRVMVVVVGEHE